ncbi:transcriptional regulator [Spirillospora sp. NPDC052269]
MSAEPENGWGGGTEAAGDGSPGALDGPSGTAARLLRLLGLLQARREWSGPELARRLGVSVRTVRRDVERLRALDYPVRAAAGPVGGYRLEAGAAVAPLLLDDAEAVAVAVGLVAAASGGSAAGAAGALSDEADGAGGEAALRALAKLEQVLPARLRRRVAAVARATVPVDGPDAGPRVDPGALAVLAAAVRDGERVRFGYRDREGRVSRRLVEPSALVAASRRWYLVAFDLEARDDASGGGGSGAWRTFRLDRVDEVFPTGVRVPRREVPGGDPAAWVRRSRAGGRPVVRAVLRVHAPAEVLADRLRVRREEIEPLDDGSCLLRTLPDSLEWTAMRLAHLELEFTVLEPPELADRLREAGARLLRAAGPPTGATSGTGASGGTSPEAAATDVRRDAADGRRGG